MSRHTQPLHAGKTESSPTEADAPPTVTGVVLPETILRFRIDGPLGAGGMADVFRAHDPMLDRPVALKVLRAKLADDRRRRTLREARAAAALSHPNIITIYEVEEADGVVVIAMELLEGRVLRAAMGDIVPLATKLRWLLQMALALDAAHARGLVHRDVKPDNMFVCDSGALKLLDFGIAKRQDSDDRDDGDEETGPSSLATTEGRRIGTPRYMAPEQHLGASTDARTDQHAWALVAFELLTGRHAAAEIETVPDGLASAAPSEGGERRALLAAVPGLPDVVATAILRALSADRDARFPSMAPIIAILEGAHAGVPSRPSRRRPVLLALVAIAFAAVVVVSGVQVYRRMQPAVDPRTRATLAPPVCRIESSRSVPDTEKVASLGLLPPDGALVTYLPHGEDETGFLREQNGALVPFSPLPPVAHLVGEIRGGTVKGEPALAVVFRGVRGTISFWSEAQSRILAARGIGYGIVSSHSFPYSLGRPAVTQAFGDMFAVVGGIVQSDERLAGVFGAFSAGDAGGKNLVSVRPGERLDLASAAGTSDRLAATFSGGLGLHFTYFDRIGNPAGPFLTIEPITASETTITGENPFMLLSAVALAGGGTHVYWIDRRDLGHLFVATLNEAGTAFGPKRVVATEPFSVLQPLATQLTDGRSVLLWGATVQGNPVLRLAPILPNGDLEGALELARGTFRDVSLVPTARGVAVGWIDDATGNLRAVTAHCP